MASEERVAHLTLYVNASQSVDDERRDELTRQLLREIKELDVESAQILKEGDIPPGAKPAEAFTLGALAIAALPTVLPQLIAFLQSWLMRGEGRTIKIKTQVKDRSLEVEYNSSTMSQAELMHLVETLTGALTKSK